MNYIANDTRVGQTAVGETSSDQMLLSLGLGRSIYKRDWALDISGRFNYLQTEIDRFSETIAGTGVGAGLGLEIDSQEVESMTSDISIRLSKSISTQWGVFVPYGGLTWYHEFEDKDDSLRVRFLNDPFSVDFSQSGLNAPGGGGATIFEVPLDDVDTNYGNISLGGTLLYPNGLSLNFGINTVVGLDSTDSVYYTVGARKDL